MYFLGIIAVFSTICTNVDRPGHQWRIYASVNLEIIASGNGLSPSRRYVTGWSIDDLSSISTPEIYQMKWNDHSFPAERDNNVENVWNHQRTIICIQNLLLFCLIGSVNDLDTISCPSVSSLWSDCEGVCHGCHRYLWDFLHLIYSGDNWCGGWQLMCPFRFVAVPVCGLFGLWSFQFVAVSVCDRFGLWPFRSVAVPVCGRFGLWPFRLWPFRFVAVMTCYR